MKKFLFLFCLLPCTILAQTTIVQQTASAVRYWFDTEHWFDTEPATVSTLTAEVKEIDVSHLTGGLHTLHCQVVNADGTMSYVRSVMFLKPNIAYENLADATLRYWFDEETTVYTTTADVEVIKLPNLGKGTHTLHTQVVHADGTLGYIRSESYEQETDEFESEREIVSVTKDWTLCSNSLITIDNKSYVITQDTIISELSVLENKDSTTIHRIKVNPTYAVTDTKAILESQLPYEWNGLTFAAEGTQTVSLSTVSGCDSVVEMVLTVVPDGWNPDHPDNPGNYELKLEVNNSAMGSVTGAGLYAHNTKVDIASTPATGHYFVKWSDDVESATRTVVMTQDLSLTAIFAVSEYSVTFVNYDGSVLQQSDAAYGSTPVYAGETPLKPATAQYSYTFKGWTPEIVSVSGEATYTAQYDEVVNQYTVTFINYDGSVLQQSDVAYGSTPEYAGETPLKPATAQYSYTFKGWTPEIVSVSGEATYTAQFDEELIALDSVFVSDYQDIAALPIGQQTHIVVYETGYLDVTVPTIASSLTLVASSAAAQVANQYTLNMTNVPDNTDVFLTYQGNNICDLTQSATRIYLERGYNEGYKIHINRKPDIETDVRQDEGASVSVKKMILDGRLYILMPDGRMYNAVGQGLHK